MSPEQFRSVQFGRERQVGGEITSWLQVRRPSGDGSVVTLTALFAGPQNLIYARKPVFKFGEFDHKGQVMDSVEPARHWSFLRTESEPPYFWLIGKSGGPGEVKFIEVSTEFHNGNHAQSVEVALFDAKGLGREPSGPNDPAWVQVVPRTECDGHSRMLFAIEPTEATHFKLIDHPDGGVSRLRIYEDAKFVDQGPTRGAPWLCRSDEPIIR